MMIIVLLIILSKNNNHNSNENNDILISSDTEIIFGIIHKVLYLLYYTLYSSIIFIFFPQGTNSFFPLFNFHFMYPHIVLSQMLSIKELFSTFFFYLVKFPL